MQATDFSVQQVTLTPGTMDYAVAAPQTLSSKNNSMRTGGTSVQQAPPDGSILANENVDVGLSWRMVDDGATVLALFQSEGTTSTINNLFCAGTKQECVDQAATAGLTMPDAILQSDKVIQ